MLIGPCFDSNGKLRGVIQLVNKFRSEPISFRDEKEFSQLLPSVAEMIKQADEVKYVGDISANLNLCLAQSKESILNSSKIFEERNMAGIHAAMQHVLNRVDAFSKQKQANTIKENLLSQHIFSTIRDDSVAR